MIESRCNFRMKLLRKFVLYNKTVIEWTVFL